MYKQVHFSSINLYKLLIKVREGYIALVTNDQCTKKNEECSNSGKSTYHKRSDITALLTNSQDSAGKIKTLERELRQSRANLALKQNGQTSNPPSGKTIHALYS